MAAIALTSLLGFVFWEGRAAQPIIQIELFRSPRFAVVNLVSAAIYLVTFSVMLIGPYFLVRYTGLTLLQAGFVLASGFIAMAVASPFAGTLVARVGAQWIAPLGALATGIGLFAVGTWQPDTPTLLMVLSLGLQGIGTGFFQVAYMDIVMAASPLAHRGVAGSLSMLTRTIGVVTGAAALTLGFQAFESAALTQGAGEVEAFLSAFRTMFRLAGITAVIVGATIACLAPRRR